MSSFPTLYFYEPAGRRASMQAAHGLSEGVFTYIHDAAGRLTVVENPQNKRTTLSYDSTGRTIQKLHANGMITTNVFDSRQNLTGIINVKSTGALVSRLTYTYDNVGNRVTQLDQNNITTTWTYDAAYQLIREHRPGVTSDGFDIEYTYDPAGNRITETNCSGACTTYVYDEANQLQKTQMFNAVTTFIHDEAGNRIEKQSPVATSYYAFDDRNQLAQAEVAEGVVTMTYNGNGQRVSRQSVTGEEKRYLYDFKKLLQESDDDNDPTTTYNATLDEYGALLSEYDEDLDEETSFTFDGQWSAEALVDEAQDVTERYKYRAFGLITEGDPDRSGPTFKGDVNYQPDTDLDLYLLGAGNSDGGGRHYDPAIGRFLSEDPIGFAAGDENLYRYVGNNPVNAIDPGGQQRASGYASHWISLGDNILHADPPAKAGTSSPCECIDWHWASSLNHTFTLEYIPWHDGNVRTTTADYMETRDRCRAGVYQIGDDLTGGGPRGGMKPPASRGNTSPSPPQPDRSNWTAFDYLLESFANIVDKSWNLTDEQREALKRAFLISEIDRTLDQLNRDYDKLKQERASRPRSGGGRNRVAYERRQARLSKEMSAIRELIDSLNKSVETLKKAYNDLYKNTGVPEPWRSGRSSYRYGLDAAKAYADWLRYGQNHGIQSTYDELYLPFGWFVKIITGAAVRAAARAAAKAVAARAAKAAEAAAKKAAAEVAKKAAGAADEVAGVVAKSINPGKLTFDPATKSWTSNGGLVYGQGSAQGNRVLHVLDHLSPNPAKPVHTLFNVDRTKLVGLIDEAWAMRGANTIHPLSKNWNYRIEMGRVIGVNGETAINISVRPGTSQVITVFPTP